MNVTWGIIRSWHALPPTRALRSIRDFWTGTSGELRYLARQFGVTEGAIRFVVTGRTWAWVS